MRLLIVTRVLLPMGISLDEGCSFEVFTPLFNIETFDIHR